jgi:O-antigen/teichoic acid export membrane protein
MQEPAQNAASDREQLDKSLVHGIAWSGAAKWSTQALSWLATILVARLLTPGDYGLVSMAAVFLGLIILISEFGVGSAVVVLRGLTREQIGQLNGLSVIFGIAGFAVSCAIAIPVGHFFGSPRLPAVLVVMSLVFIISSFQSVPAAILQKELKFRKLSMIDASRGVIQAVGMIVLALLGFGYWTLVFGALLGAAAYTTQVLICCPHPLNWPRLRELRHALGYSWRVLVARIAWYGYSNADFVVAGRVLGQAPLGDYTLAWNLANTPVEKVTSLVGAVTPAYYSAVQSDHAALRRYLLRPVEAIALVAFPVLVGLALVAREAVLTLLGRKWEGAIAALSLLCIYACVRAVMPLITQVLLVVGESSFVMWISILSLVLLPLAFLAGSHWGPAGIAAAWVLSYPLNAVPSYLRLARRIDMSAAEFVRALWPALNGVLVLAAVVLLAKALLSRFFHINLGVLLGVEVACGAVAYGSVLMLFHRKRVFAFRRALGSLKG